MASMSIIFMIQENSISRLTSRRTIIIPMQLGSMDIKQVCKKIAEKGLVVGASGNVSERHGEFFCITASSTRLDCVDTILSCGIDSENIPSGASIETRMHRAIYRERSDVNAIIHANPPYSTLLACSNQTVNTSLIPEGNLIHPVHYVGVFPPGSKELASAVASAALKSNVIILKNHGVVVMGRSLKEALNRLEYLEFICGIVIMARMSGITLHQAES